jgi:hypothetical protein
VNFDRVAFMKRALWWAKQERARRLAMLAVKSRRLTRETCEVCGAAKVDAHHDNYDHPLSVRWMCRTHHKDLHTKIARWARGASNDMMALRLQDATGISARAW